MKDARNWTERNAKCRFFFSEKATRNFGFCACSSPPMFEYSFDIVWIQCHLIHRNLALWTNCRNKRLSQQPALGALTFLRSFVAGKENFCSHLLASLVHFTVVKSQAILIIRLGVTEVITRAGRHRVEVSPPFFFMFFSGRSCSALALCECWTHVPKGSTDTAEKTSAHARDVREFCFRWTFTCTLWSKHKQTLAQITLSYTLYIHSGSSWLTINTVSWFQMFSFSFVL